MGRRVVPQVVERPKYYFERVPGGQWKRVPILADANSNNTAAVASAAVAAAKKKSKLTDAERTRLKGVLKEALSNVQYAQFQTGGSSGGTKRLAVLLVNASQEDFQGELPVLREEVFEEDATAFHAYHMGLRRQMRKEQTLTTVGVNKTGVLGSIAAAHGENAHPNWYFGFWDDTSVTVEVAVKNPPGGGHFPSKTLGSAIIHFGERTDDRPTLTMDITTANNGKNLKTIAEYVELDEAPHLDPLAFTHFVGYPQNNNDANEPEGILTVYNMFQWRDHWVTSTIRDEDDQTIVIRYFNPDLFDRVTVTITAIEEIRIHEIVITINGLDICSGPNPLLIPAGSTKKIRLKNKIETDRRSRLLYNGTSSPSGTQYSSDKITNNRFLQVAAGEFGKAWCRKYGSEWEKDDDGNWKCGPRYWCGSSALWVIRKEGSLLHLNPPWPDQWGGALWLRENGRLYHPFNTSWANLGAKIKPGDYINFYGHAGFFLYWIELPFRAPNRAPHYNSLADDDPEAELSHFGAIFGNSAPTSGDPLPADFVVDSDINWFRYIAGNNSGRFNIGTGAVINLKRWRLNEVIVPMYDSHRHGHTFLPWCHDHEFNRDLFYNEDKVGSPPGFGRTDGEVVIPEFKPRLRPEEKPSLE